MNTSTDEPDWLRLTRRQLLAAALGSAVSVVTTCTTNSWQLQAAQRPANGGTNGNGITLGVFVYDPALGGSAPWSPEVVDNYIALIGGRPGAWHWFEPFSTGFTRSNFEAVDARGMTPILSWAPTTASGETISDARIANGEIDGPLRQFAQDAKAWGKPFYLRLGWEMNLPHMGCWAVGTNGNTSEDFVAMWRYVHDIFYKEGTTNVRWYWCPAQFGSGPSSFASMYPGDTYVDAVGFDAYNWGNSQYWSSWSSLADLYRESYDTLAALTQKPMIVGETGSVEGGGDKAAWIRQGFLTDLPTQFPRIIGVIYFNQDYPASGIHKRTDWRVNTSPASLSAFKDVVASPLYKGKLP